MRRSYIPDALRRKVIEAAHNCCGYCLASQEFSNIPLEIEHIIPPDAGGTDEEDNLWAACSACNSHKSDRTHARDPQTGRTARLFNPRKQKWKQHFK
jgi:5-methylcytosine-specific restriction endonuclease McrA